MKKNLVIMKRNCFLKFVICFCFVSVIACKQVPTSQNELGGSETEAAILSVTYEQQNSIDTSENQFKNEIVEKSEEIKLETDSLIAGLFEKYVHEPTARAFANRAISSNGGKSKGKCWLYVNNAISGKGGARMGMSAIKFFKSTSAATMKNVFGLCTLKKATGENETVLGQAPIGSVIGYAPGYKGFSRAWGHGEIKVSEDKFCSDFCAKRDKNLTASFILYPCAKGSAVP